MAHPRYLPFQKEHMETVESGGTVVDGQRIGGKNITIKRTETEPGGSVMPAEEREAELRAKIAARRGTLPAPQEQAGTPFYQLGTGPLSTPPAPIPQVAEPRAKPAPVGNGPADGGMGLSPLINMIPEGIRAKFRSDYGPKMFEAALRLQEKQNAEAEEQEILKKADIIQKARVLQQKRGDIQQGNK